MNKPIYNCAHCYQSLYRFNISHFKMSNTVSYANALRATMDLNVEQSKKDRLVNKCILKVEGVDDLLAISSFVNSDLFGKIVSNADARKQMLVKIEKYPELVKIVGTFVGIAIGAFVTCPTGPIDPHSQQLCNTCREKDFASMMKSIEHPIHENEKVLPQHIVSKSNPALAHFDDCGVLKKQIEDLKGELLESQQNVWALTDRLEVVSAMYSKLTDLLCTNDTDGRNVSSDMVSKNELSPFLQQNGLNILLNHNQVPPPQSQVPMPPALFQRRQPTSKLFERQMEERRNQVVLEQQRQHQQYQQLHASLQTSERQRSSEQRSSEQRSSEQRSSERQRPSEQRSSEQRSSEQRSSERQRPSEQRSSERQRPSEQRSSERQRSSEQRSSEQRSSEQQATKSNLEKYLDTIKNIDSQE